MYLLNATSTYRLLAMNQKTKNVVVNLNATNQEFEPRISTLKFFCRETANIKPLLITNNVTSEHV